MMRHKKFHFSSLPKLVTYSPLASIKKLFVPGAFLEIDGIVHAFWNVSLPGDYNHGQN